MATCIVCDVDIEAATAAPETGYGSEQYPPAQSEYQGTVYQFCCTDHKETFQEDPGRFVDRES
jgi:YHS domain-containing protein